VVDPGIQSRSYGLSIWFGTALIAVGVVVDVFAAWNHVRLNRQLNGGISDFTRPSRASIALALFLAAVGVAMAIYLIWI
jgi:uncharacterized membrane protein YidH (DUF202 family)